MQLEREHIEEIVEQYIKNNLTVDIQEKRDFYTRQTTLKVVVRLGQDVIYTSETY